MIIKKFFFLVSLLCSFTFATAAYAESRIDTDKVETIVSIYQKKLSKTPNYFLVPLQKAIYQNSNSVLYPFLKDPSELASTVVKYLQNSSISNDELLLSLYDEISLFKKESLSKHNPRAIVHFIKKVAHQYKQNLEKMVPDIVFRPESGLCFTYNNIPYVFLSNFSSKHGHGTRLREVTYNKEWFVNNGYIVIEVPKELPFEGSAEIKYVKHGDSVDMVFGYGFRTDFKTIAWVTDKLKEILKDDFQKVTIIPAHIIDEAYYHLDTALKEIPIISRS